MEIVHSTQEVISKKISKKFSTILALWRHLDPKNALFGYFEQTFADFRLFDHYNMKIIL